MCGEVYNIVGEQLFRIAVTILHLCLVSFQSPLSMKVTFRELQEGSTLTLQDALKMEFRLSQRFMQDSDFFEGVGAGGSFSPHGEAGTGRLAQHFGMAFLVV